MTRLELPSSPIAVAHGPDRAAALRLGPPHNGLLIVSRVCGVSNVDPGGRRHCRYFELFAFFRLFRFTNPKDFILRGTCVCQEATVRFWTRGTVSAKGLEEETKELDSELHLRLSFGRVTTSKTGGGVEQ